MSDIGVLLAMYIHPDVKKSQSRLLRSKTGSAREGLL
jgi:hypothetical protein